MFSLYRDIKSSGTVLALILPACLFPSFPNYPSVFTSVSYPPIYFSSFPLRPHPLLSHLPPSISFFSCHILSSFLYPSIPSSLPGGEAALTCICLAWMSPRFGLNAPIILVNYDVLLWAMLLQLRGARMKAGTAQQSHLQRRIKGTFT